MKARTHAADRAGALACLSKRQTCSGLALWLGSWALLLTGLSTLVQRL